MCLPAIKLNTHFAKAKKSLPFITDSTATVYRKLVTILFLLFWATISAGIWRDQFPVSIIVSSDAISLFTYLRPRWQTLKDFVSLCGDLEPAHLASSGSVPRLVEVLRPILTSFPKGPSFSEATETLNAYQGLKQKQQQQQQQQQNVSHEESFTCIPWVSLSHRYFPKSPLPRIAVMTTATRNNRNLNGDEYNPEARIVYEAAYNASLKEKTDYCAHHGYDFHVITDTVEGRNTGWYRLPALLSLLPRYEWIFHLDLDTVIWNNSIRLEQFLDPTHDLIIGVDHNGINCGAFFMHNSTWNRMFIAEAWTLLERPASGYYYYEQSAMMQLMKLDGVRNHVKVVPQQQFNSYLNGTAFPTGESQPFLVHFAGQEDKWELLQRFTNEKQGQKHGNGALPSRGNAG